MIQVAFHPELPIIMGRLVLAVLLCGLIGFEREINQHPAGFRTHLLVGVGSCLMMVLSLYGFDPFLEEENIRFDPARIPAYVISGIGFLGAGTILVKDSTVRGLTTAASIWVVAGLGLIIGAGLYSVAVVTTILILLILIALNKFESSVIQRRKKEKLEVTVTNKECLRQVLTLVQEYKGQIHNIKAKDDFSEFIISFSIDKRSEMKLVQQLFFINGVESFTNL
ncbi:MgtC/SapB family protein [Bacillus suaedaesalsae]|uniref:MgtC/SapB family protein n=1 Tax=Bacillus suaedaesalsae TaxID=2810349 RepID=A0ABS2DCC9_9BACI|nr:MgtC/SapB family protein [Bacillus suaedaesalsae]MBM6616104.1 MgtC/SapB family protein [Bacillus suaedaesalsae]